MPRGPGDKTLAHGYKINHLPNTFKKFYGTPTDLVGLYKKCLSNVCSLYHENIFFFRFVKAKLIKLAGMESLMHEANHAYSIQST